jgi:hypothetical protein
MSCYGNRESRTGKGFVEAFALPDDSPGNATSPCCPVEAPEDFADMGLPFKGHCLLIQGDGRDLHL